jgi:uncharacterized repeat protein (TIGR01451 family)
MKLVKRPLSGSVAAAFCALLALALPAAAEELSSSAAAQLQGLMEEKALRTPAQQKMDSQLIYALRHSRNQPMAPGVQNLRLLTTNAPDGRVWIDLKATVTTNLLSFIQSSGGFVLNSFPQFDAVRALVPLELTETLGGRADVQAVRAAVPAIRRTGTVNSEGDVTHRAGLARTNFLTQGYGVRVGVLSDSVDFLAQAQATGDLPGDVAVLPGQAGTGIGEGTAMLEIINDLAPMAKLSFATAGNGPASFAQNILDLQASGCDILVDDVSYADESPFQDGVVAKAVSTVTSHGVMYFSAAGNDGNLKYNTSSTWEGDFLDGGAAPAPVNVKPGNIHGYTTNINANMIRDVGSAWITLFWTDPLGASTNDYDLFLLDPTGQNIVASSTTIQLGLQDPIETLPAGLPGELIVIVKAAAAEPRFLHLTSAGGPLALATTGSVLGHCASSNAICVSACSVSNSFPNPFTTAALVEDFTSDGPRRLFFAPDGTALTPGLFLAAGGALLPKPELTAADEVSTTLPPGGLNPFFGTSAAAPHAAAIAALLKSYNPSLSSAQILKAMTNSALDIETRLWDEVSGNGIVMADRALQEAQPPPAIPRLIITTNFVTGGNGNGMADVNECNDLFVVLDNIGRAEASGIRVTVSTTTPGAAIAQATARYPDLAIGGLGTNLTAFKLSTSPLFKCGTAIQLRMVIKCDQLFMTNFFTIPTGVPGKPIQFDSLVPAVIPDGRVTNLTLTVSNFTYAVNKIAVSMYATHTFDSDLLIELIGPDGTTCVLSRNEGGNGQNYGFACSPTSYRTIFDDAATTPINQGIPPFIGPFRPEEALFPFVGKSGTNINGTWTLRVTDQVLQDAGVVQCWSVSITPMVCPDGGGECPGADLALGMFAQPEPLVLGSYLTYTLMVTNNGPSAARTVTISQVLPSTVDFISATPSQGSVSRSGSVLTCSLGQLDIGGVATVSVLVLPKTDGIISSSATAVSEQPDSDLANSSATVFTHVTPPTADLSVNISAAPSPTTVGGTLNYTVNIGNNGPVTASAITVSNVLPVFVAIRSATSTRGAIAFAGNVVIASIPTLGVGESATLSIATIPTGPGALLATSTVTSQYPDPVSGNNIASVTTLVRPSADLVLSLSALPNPVVSQSNLTYTLLVTNLGPSDATEVAINGALPPGTIVVADSTTGAGPIAYQDLTFQAPFGTLSPGTGGAVTITVSTPEVETNLALFASAAVTGNEFDPTPSNNVATVSTIVAPPFLNIVPAGATLTYESGPTNGAVDIGETVTVDLRLSNFGNIDATNLIATLVATNGVEPLPANQTVTYGALSSGGLSVVSRSFGFRAHGSSGGTVTAVLRVSEGSTSLGVVRFNFLLPQVLVFTNLQSISIPDSGAASPYPCSISVSGVTGVVGSVTATLSDMSHTFPRDVDVLLVGPSGRKTILMSGAGDEQSGFAHIDLTFDDAFPPIADPNTQIQPGTYHPANYLPDQNLLAPAPAGPYSASMSVFNGVEPNGLWHLYVDDHFVGDSGDIAGGWRLSLSMISAVNQVTDVGLSAAVTPTTPTYGKSLTNTFMVVNGGPGAVSLASFNDVLPAGVTLVSATSSQGSVTVSGGTNINVSLGSFAAGASAQVTIVLTPSTPGPLTNTATVSLLSGEVDLAPVNNTATASVTVVMPTADLVVSQTGAPSPVTLTSNVLYTLTVTNAGPGVAYNARLTDQLPGLANINLALGDLAPGRVTNYSFVVTPQIVRPLTNTASVITDSTDPVPANNSSTSVLQVLAQTPRLIAGATALKHESVIVNGGIDAAETVTVSLTLQNVGSASTSSGFRATLLSGGGVSSPSGEGSYGSIAPGQSKSRNFNFTSSAGGGAVSATLQLDDNGNNLGTVTFLLSGAATTSFSSTNFVSIPDHGTALPYPSAIVVSNLTGTITKVSLSLDGLTHSFVKDVSVLLVSPAGTRVLLMSHVGGGLPVTNLTLGFDDDASTVLSSTGPINSSTNQSSVYGSVAFPGVSAPYGSALSALKWSNPNGIWSLYLLDDSSGDAGSLRGWTLNLATTVPMNPLVDLGISLSSTPAVLYAGGLLTNTMSVTNLGPSTASAVYVTQPLPPDVSFLPQFSQGSSGGGQVVSFVGDLPVGGSAQVRFVLAPAAAGVLTNVVSVTGSDEETTPANNAAQAFTTVYPPEPVVLSGSVEHGSFFLTGTAQAGLLYVIQGSVNLSSWVPISTNQAAADNSIVFVDTNCVATPYRFFRTRLWAP